MKTESQFSVERVKASTRTRFNPIRGLTPTSLSRMLDQLDAGDLRMAAMLFEKIERRDDTLMSVIPKRKKDAARRPYTITATDDSPRAKKHVEALEYFFRHIQVTSAIEGTYLQGFPGLVRTMMDAVGKKWAVHEIIWRPGLQGMTAELKFVPLWFFEHRTGELRFLESDYAQNGVDLEDGEWMVTNGEGLMEGCSVSYMFKSMAQKDWVIFCEKFGLPYVWAKTGAQKNAEEMEDIHQAVQNWMNDGGMVTSGDVDVTTVSASAGTLIPMKELIERIDQRFMSIWRGGDLSTQSQGDSVGASVQEGETELILGEDLEMIATTINMQLVPHIIMAVLGDDTPLAKIDLPMADGDDVTSDLEIDKFLIDSGVPLSEADLRDRYARPAPSDDEDVVGGKKEEVSRRDAKPQSEEEELEEGKKFANEDSEARTLVENAVAKSLDVMPSVLSPIAHVFEALIAAAESGNLSDEEFIEAAEETALSIPEMIGDLDVGSLARIMEGAMGTAVLAAITEETTEINES